MKKTLMNSVAAGALLFSASLVPATLVTGAALAQDTQPTTEEQQPADDAAPAEEPATEEPTAEEPAAEEPAAEEPAAGEPAAEEPAAEEPAAEEPAAEEPAAEEPATEEPAAEEPAAEEPAADEQAAGEGEMFMTEQSEDEVAASRYIGQPVFNTADERLGEINDLIFAKDGGITAAVVGVGGFLGIGEKDVAVAFDMIEIQTQPDTAEVRLVINANREQLESAPEYTTLEEKIAEQQQQTAPAPGAGGTMGTAPATSPAPATGTAPAQ